MKASSVVDAAERAREFRKLGFPVSESEMVALSKGFPFRPGTEEFAKHVQKDVDKLYKARDPGKNLAMIRGFTDLDDKMRKKLVRRLFENWYQRDPQAARANAASLSESEGRVEVLALLAPPATTTAEFSRILAMPEGRDRYTALDAGIEALLWADPATAVRTLEALPAGKERNEAIRLLAGNWAKRDLAAALSWIEKIPARERQELLETALISGAESQPKAAADAAVRLMDPKAHLAYFAVGSVAEALAKSDPAGAVKFVDRFPSLVHGRLISLQKIAPMWGATDPVEALVWAQQLPAEEQANAVRSVLTGWIKSPKGKLSEAREMAGHLPEALRPGAIEAVVLAWGETEPPAAAAFAMKETPGLLTEVVRQWIKRDEAAALAWARGLSDPEARDRALAGACRARTETDLPKATRIAEEIRGPALRDEMLSKIASGISKANGTDAALEILRKVDDPKLRDGALGMMVSRVSRENPRKAIELLDLISQPEKRSEALDSILTWGSETDPQACRELLAKLPQVEGLHYQRVAGGFAAKDPAAAAAWALTLPDGESKPRKAAFNQVMNVWGAKDPDGATRWVRSATLPEALRTDALHIIKFQRDFRAR
jgi:hypothetical protein